MPVLIAHGEDHKILRRLSSRRARAFAAMSADDLDSVDAVTPLSHRAPWVRVALRAARDHAVITKARSLFPIGGACGSSAMTVHAVAASVNVYHHASSSRTPES